MNNSWNKVIYKIWLPIYDRLFNTGRFLRARKQVFQEIKFRKETHILFVGVGTGADLEFVDQSEQTMTAIDVSPDMLQKARGKFPDASIQFLEMDAQEMAFEDQSFDIVIASLILSVVPDTDQCFREMVRVLKPKGRMIIFDKFAPKEKELSVVKKIIRPVIKLLGTDIGLNFEQLYTKRDLGVVLEEDQPIMLNNMYRKIVLTKSTN